MGKNSLMTKREFKNGFNKLQECFPNSANISTETVMRYWEYLNKKFSSDEFNATVEKIIISERFFPSISVFFEHKEHSLSQKAF